MKKVSQSKPIAPLANGEQSTKVLFDSIVDLIRNGSPTFSAEKAPKLPDSARLELYGLYKIATEACGPDPKGCPSILKVVARAKYKAWADAAEKYSSVKDAMESYADVAGPWLVKGGLSEELEGAKKMYSASSSLSIMEQGEPLQAS